MITSVSRRSNV